MFSLILHGMVFSHHRRSVLQTTDLQHVVHVEDENDAAEREEERGQQLSGERL